MVDQGGYRVDRVEDQGGYLVEEVVGRKLKYDTIRSEHFLFSDVFYKQYPNLDNTTHPCL